MTRLMLKNADCLRVSFAIKTEDLQYVNNCLACKCCSCFVNKALGCRISTVRVEVYFDENGELSDYGPVKVDRYRGLKEQLEAKENEPKFKDQETLTEDLEAVNIKSNSKDLQVEAKRWSSSCDSGNESIFYPGYCQTSTSPSILKSAQCERSISDVSTQTDYVEIVDRKGRNKSQVTSKDHKRSNWMDLFGAQRKSESNQVVCRFVKVLKQDKQKPDVEILLPELPSKKGEEMDVAGLTTEPSIVNLSDTSSEVGSTLRVPTDSEGNKSIQHVDKTSYERRNEDEIIELTVLNDSSSELTACVQTAEITIKDHSTILSNELIDASTQFEIAMVDNETQVCPSDILIGQRSDKKVQTDVCEKDLAASTGKQGLFCFNPILIQSMHLKFLDEAVTDCFHRPRGKH